MQPLWPAYLAAYLEKNVGHGLFDFHWQTGDIENALASFKPHVVAISAITPYFNYALEYAHIVKQSGIPVVIGGMHISALPKCLSNEMDIGVIGEGEETFSELMRLYLETGTFAKETLGKIKGIVFRNEHGELIATPKREAISPLDAIPHPKRSLVGYGYRQYLYTARGCQYNCVFCACTKHWGKVRYASPAYVLEEIQELVENGVKVIRFNEDNFISDKARTKEIVDMVVKKGFDRKVKFSCWCRANDVTPEIVALLKKMNVVSVKMGLESGCDRTLSYLKGGVNVKNNSQAINLLKDAGIQVNADFIIGAPHETEDEIMMTYDFIKKARVDMVDVNVLSPLPGTALWNYSVGRRLVSEQMDWSMLKFQSSKLIISETLTYEKLERLVKKFERLRFLKTIKALPKSPWLNELPRIVLAKCVETLSKIFSRVPQASSAPRAH